VTAPETQRVTSSSNRAVVVQIAGGLGNQLFEYAFGRGISAASGAPLVLDAYSGFPRDMYKRKYTLDRFNVRAELVPKSVDLSTPIGRVKRRVALWRNRKRPLEQKTYIREPTPPVFEPALLKLPIDRRVFFDGYWQFEPYFSHVADDLRRELTLKEPPSDETKRVAERIRGCEAVCLHVRRLHGVPNTANAAPLATDTSKLHLDASYYPRALDAMLAGLSDPHVFVFSDYPDWAREHIRASCPVEFVTHNPAARDYEDLYLMSQCRHFVIANSTFSWWGAWLGTSPDKRVIAPAAAIGKMLVSVPPQWQLL